MTLDMERGPQTIEWGFVDRWVRLCVSSTFLRPRVPSLSWQIVVLHHVNTCPGGYVVLTHQRMLLLFDRPWRITLLTVDSSRSAGYADPTHCTVRAPDHTDLLATTTMTSHVA
eukprot:COSAG06_NODE_1323_length_9859_cov_3.820082_10_plen_113_part_00